MGVSSTEVRALCALKRSGELGDEILSLGRPEIYIPKHQLKALAMAYDLGWSDADIAEVSSETYAEPLLKLLGFRTIRSLDISAYQEADIIHDLNLPIPKHLEATTSFLYGNGTIEHIFDIATVLKNIVRLVKVGGTAFILTPANGQCGHGFYQFSPEFFITSSRQMGSTIPVYTLWAAVIRNDGFAPPIPRYCGSASNL